MKLLLIGCLLLSACGSASNSEVTANDATPINEASLDAETSDRKDSYMDTGEAPLYNPCEYKTSQTTSYARLTEIDCHDSNGNVIVKNYWDSELKISCRWNKADDFKFHCLPENSSTALQYGDNGCTESVGLVADGAGPYIGLEQEDFVIIYSTGSIWSGETLYYKVLNGSEWKCFPLHIDFLGLKVYYVGSRIDPNIFVER